MVIESNKKMERKANEKFKPQQPHGCEDLDDEYNEASAFFADPTQ